MKNIAKSGLLWALLLTLPITVVFEGLTQSVAVWAVCPAEYSEFRFVSTQTNGDYREINGSTLCSVPGAYEACAFGKSGCTEQPVSAFAVYGAIFGVGFLFALLPGFGIAWLRRKRTDGPGRA